MHPSMMNRLTLGFSKKYDNFAAAMALHLSEDTTNASTRPILVSGLCPVPQIQIAQAEHRDSCEQNESRSSHFPDKIRPGK